MLTTTGGLNIAAYKVDVANPKAIVIFISGMGDAPVSGFFGHARMLKENGFGSMLLEMRARGERPALIIHSTGDSVVPFSSFGRIMENAPEHVESWIVKGDRHMIVECFTYFLNPQDDEEYSERILAFLNKHFGK